MPLIKINEERCKGCKLCIHFCPLKILAVSETLNAKGFFPAKLTDERKCSGCAICAIMCPDVAIEVFKEEKGAKNGKDSDEGK